MSPIKVPAKIQLVEKRETRTSRGMLSKGWYRVDDQLVMVKGNSITEAGTAGQIWPDAAGLSQESAPCAVQPDAAERYALATFAGCPENGLRVAGTHDDHSVRQVPRAGQRARTASLGSTHERAESAGRGSGGEGSRVYRMKPQFILSIHPNMV